MNGCPSVRPSVGPSVGLSILPKLKLPLEPRIPLKPCTLRQAMLRLG